jgi:hypothetical protein
VESLPVDVEQDEVEVELELTGPDPVIVSDEPSLLGEPSLGFGRDERRPRPERVVSARLWRGIVVSSRTTRLRRVSARLGAKRLSPPVRDKGGDKFHLRVKGGDKPGLVSRSRIGTCRLSGRLVHLPWGKFFVLVV